MAHQHERTGCSLLVLLVAASACGLAECRGLRQDVAAPAAVSANNQQLPRLVIGRVKASVVNTYAWSIQRQATASGIALTADGVSRKQLGHTLSYTRSLASTAYKLEGVASITNPSGQGSITLLSVDIVLGSRVMQVECEGTALPGSPYELPPAGVLECAFAQTWDANPPGVDSVSGYVETSFGRAPAAEGAVAFSFRDCGKPAADGSASACALVERGACVSVTDGSNIISKYKDQLGQSLAGTVTRGGSSSRLFETSTIDDSRLGPARVEPTIPVGGSSGPSQPAAVRPAADTPPEWRPKMPDSSWWTRRLHRQQQQQPSPALSDLAAQLDASSKWPVPTIAGDRPPLGLLGRPQGAAAERRICDSRSFGYSMVFGPLLPAACGTFEVQNVAAALPTDGSSAAVAHSTYFHLQVLCPAKTETGAAQGG